jgi:hypothetical protein
MTDGVPPILKMLLSANAHGPVIKAIIETLGDGAVEEFANAVRRLDQRVSGGELREIETIAAEHIGQLKTKDRDKPRKQLERIVREFVQRSAKQVLGTKAEHERGGPWQTALAAVALDIIRTHGAVDVLDEWVALERRRTKPGRSRAHQKITKKNAERNTVILAEAEKSPSKIERKQAESAAVEAQLKGYTDATPAAARGVIRRRKTRQK